MSSWFSSWLSGLPKFDFAVPSNIQRRFFSFLLRRTLGHFLKPGQLDLHQIDSQLGSGVVQVKDLELDGQAINQLLVGLPVSLDDGFISGVTARIPFPNPLSSSVGLHVQSLNLTFQINPEQSISSTPPFFPTNSNLADSVVSVAETFIHDELTPREGATLRQTLKPSGDTSPLVDESENLPGGFNPSGYNLSAEEALKEPRGEDDPAGVSVFATLIERILAKFEFSAVETKITIVYPRRASFTLSISEITYHTDPDHRSEMNDRLQSMSRGDNSCRQTRTVSISGLKVTSRDLRVVTSPTATSTLSPVSNTTSRKSSPLHCSPSVGLLSRNSSSSSLDEDAQLMMSQSIAMLPPASPQLLSTASSMYQSAVSTTNAQYTEDNHPKLPTAPQITHNIRSVGRSRPRPRISVPCRDSVEDVLLSFGSQPIVFSLQVPSRHIQPSEQTSEASGDHSANVENFVGDKPERETLQLSVTVGTLACAFRSGHLRALLDAVDACTRSPAPSRVVHKEASLERSRVALHLEANVTIRGIVIVTLPEPTNGEVFSLDTFYERPLVPPKLPLTYLRLFLDVISVTFRLSTCSLDRPVSRAPPVPSAPVDQSISLKMVVSEISLFAFHSISSMDDLQVATPIMITDPYLPTLHVAHHYRPSLAAERPEDIELPEFQVVDWTQAKFKKGSAKLSTWRSKSRAVSRKANKSGTPSQRPCNLPGSPDPFVVSPLSEMEDKLPVPPAVEASGWLALPPISEEPSRIVDVKIAALHLFFDLGMIFKDNIFIHFVEDIVSAAIFAPKQATSIERRQKSQQNLGELSEGDMGVEKDIRVRRTSPRARERREDRERLETLVMEDLSLGMNYERAGTSKSKLSRPRPVLPNRRKTAFSERFSLRMTCPMIRVEVRCIPALHHPPRSGCLLFDLRGLIISNNYPSAKPFLRFSEETQSLPSRSSDSISNVILNVRLQEILVAYSSIGEHVARAILMLGFLPAREAGSDTGALFSTETVSDTLPLSVVLGRPSTVERSSSNHPSKFSMTVDIPLVNLVMDKVVLDGLQCWADDVAQLIGRSFTNPDSATETFPSRNPSLIGSRYFSQLRRSGTQSTDDGVAETTNLQSTGETAVKVSIMEVLLRFIVPRSGESHNTRPFDIFALDVDVLVELKPQDKDGSVVTAGVMDLRIAETSGEGDYILLVQSVERGVSSAPRHTIKSRITSFVTPETTAKESRIRVSLWGFTVHPPLDGGFGSDLAAFVRAPPGVFESVVPSECTRLTVGITDTSIHLRPFGHPGAAVLHLGEAEFSTELVGNSTQSAFKLSVTSLHIFLVDSIQDASESTGTAIDPLGLGIDLLQKSGYALVSEISHSQFALRTDNTVLPPNISIVVERICLRIRLCADTISALTSLITNMMRAPKDNAAVHLSQVTSRTPNTITSNHKHDMTASLDEHAFRLIPEVGSAADMISDDLPANQDYLDASFGAAAGLRELRDDDFEDFNMEEQTSQTASVLGQLGIVSNVGGETVRILKPFSFVEHHFDTISPDISQDPDSHSNATLQIRIRDSDIVLFLHDGFDWPRTRKVIEKEVNEMRRKLARIRQLVVAGQTQEPLDEVTSTTLFNSVHVGLENDLGNMDPDTLIAAIDEELNDSTDTETENSWQSLHLASPGRPQTASTHVHGKRLIRSKGPSIEIRLEGLNAEIDNYRSPGETLVSRMLVLVKNLEILDHIKTSTWKKFLTDMRSDSRGNVRETDSNMARIELLSVHPSPSHPAEEARLRAKLLPLRLYVDQDALDFFKKFFAFQDPDSPSAPQDGGSKEEIYFQHAEVFPVDIKLDYKPRRVDYRALRDGRTIELMNFFHFDGAEMTLRHLTLHGITGWPRFFDTLNDLWTPDVKATQLVDVISGVAPIRSVVNVGSGVADLVLLPIAQYKKDGRIVRGLQKGTKAFVQSTAMEAIKLGARLATGTQVILEQAENVLGGQFKDSVTAEALHIPYENEYAEDSDEDLISRYATQPAGLKEGVQSAYRSLQRNLLSAAQTILAVPMEVYERSGDEGAVRAVVRAVPIAVLKPMIGASEAVSKTLMGLHNTLDPGIKLENEAKYKHR